MRQSRSYARFFAGAVFISGFLFAGCGGLPELERRWTSVKPGDGGILFRYYAPSARTVQILGDWPGNDFGRGEGVEGEVLVGLMEDGDGDGVWERTIGLAPGRYRYRFLIDEVYVEIDPYNPERIPDGEGGYYSLLVVY